MIEHVRNYSVTLFGVTFWVCVMRTRDAWLANYFKEDPQHHRVYGPYRDGVWYTHTFVKE